MRLLDVLPLTVTMPTLHFRPEWQHGGIGAFTTSLYKSSCQFFPILIHSREAALIATQQMQSWLVMQCLDILSGIFIMWCGDQSKSDLGLDSWREYLVLNVLSLTDIFLWKSLLTVRLFITGCYIGLLSSNAAIFMDVWDRVNIILHAVEVCGCGRPARNGY